MLDAPLANGIHLNGGDNIKTCALDSDHNDPADSPAIDSPATPVNDSPTPAVKIDVQYNDQEASDVRHEPVDMKIEAVEDASITAQMSTPPDPKSIPIAPPNGSQPPPEGELLQDVKMAEESQSSPADEDTPMAEAVTPAPSQDVSPSAVASSSLPAVSASAIPVETNSPYSTSSPNDDDIQPPPAKRARKHSDADQASLANTATPPPASVSPPPLAENSFEVIKAKVPTLSVVQHRFCMSTVRSLKKMKAAVPFLKPVDPAALNIPHYPDVIKHPMDFSTVERKLVSSNPAKPDTNPANPCYYSAEEFAADVRLIFSNCTTFNGPDHVVTSLSRQVEEVFDKQMKNLPPAEVAKPPPVKKVVSPPPPPPPTKKPVVRRPSTSVPVIRRTEEPGRPKREIHPPPPKDLPYSDAPKKTRKAKLPKDSGVAEQLKFCDKILKDLNKKVHWTCANPFYEPVDWVKLQIPSYPKIVKRPMDLSTMRKKLDAGEYPTAEKFHEDFKLMIRNCFSFNPSGTPVNAAGHELQKVFDEKWKGLPSLRPAVVSDDEDDEDEDNSDDEHARMIADMETQIESMNRTLASLKQNKQKAKKEAKKVVEKRPPPQPVASSSKVPPKTNGKAALPPNRKKPSKKPIDDNDVLSFEQKKELSDTIGKLDGSKLERVIQIIHEGVPEIRDSTEEIELEIDTLPAAVLTKLYNFVIRPNRAPPAKRARTGKGTGTGGLKRKSMDEDVEAEKIRVLEERMALFEKGGAAAASAMSHAPSAARDAHSDHSSDSSSDDSSGSDSE